MNLPHRTGALILAAGKGTRMHSSRPKVLHTLLGEPMLSFVVKALQPCFGENIWTVVGHEAEMVRKSLASMPMRFVEQTEQLGTGHALITALPALRQADLEYVLVINGDTPLVTKQTIHDFLRDAAWTDLTFATLTLEDPASFGRVIRKDGHVAAIIEARDYDPSLHGPQTGEINAGLYLLRLSAIADLLPQLTSANRSGEYYITDLVGLAVAGHLGVQGLDCGHNPALLGVNSPAELAASENLMRQTIVRKHLLAGVIMHGPDLICIGPDAVIEPGAELTGPCEILGTTTIAAGAQIASCTVIRNSRIGEGAKIHNFCHLQDAIVGPNCLIGPYARLRPDAVTETGSHVGNFVELKKSRLGAGAKANHLSYLGDAEIGPGANIGAGTITCNYDGVHKHRTVIGAGAFIGSNSALVAPVSIGAHAVTGAGSAISKDIPDNCLGITRAPQRNLPWKKKTG